MKLKHIAALVMGMCSAPAVWAMDPFVVKDIRVEGIQRTEAGTVFSYLPVKVGETMNDEKAAQAVKALFATGFFKDVRLEAENDVLVVTLLERPAISKIEFVGMKEFEADKIKDGLKGVGLGESAIFDKALLDRAEQELKRQYFSRGKYSVNISTTVTPLERNRISIRFDVDEGVVAKIHQINIVGNKAYKESDLLDLFTLSTPGWMSWWSKNDQYSKQKLQADIETLKSFYLDQGYLEFNIDSTQVSITPDKKYIYITINITEGEKYTVSDVKLAGELLLPEEELRKLIKLNPGDEFSRKKLNESNKQIADRLGNDGYAFANINAVPDLDKEKHEAKFTFFIDPGRRVYVRRINMAGNTKTKDEVLRREMRQMEGGWYSTEKISRSKVRLDRLSYFKEVNVDTPAVPGTTDQVDVNFQVEEKPTGSVMIGAGYSSSDGILFSGSVSQNNLFGTGNILSASFSNGKANKLYMLSYTDPYFTDDGISWGLDFYLNKANPAALTQVGGFQQNTVGVGSRWGVPLSEKDTINLSVALAKTNLILNDQSPQLFKDYVDANGNSNTQLTGTAGWTRDTRDSKTYPTQGRMQNVNGEVTLPMGHLRYVKAGYQDQWFTPVTKDLVLMLNGQADVMHGYSGKDVPFFKNYYLGGVTSLRGYSTNTIGPRADDGLTIIGGTKRILGNAEVLFPFPGLKTDKSVRLSAFVDGGGLFGNNDKISFSDFRYSTGLSLSWVSPFGPLKFNLAKPFHNKPDDKLQQFQFQMGSTF